MKKVSLHAICLGKGQAPKVLLLHGWGQSLEALRSLGELISTEAEVHLIDLPGFGGSEEPDGVWGTEEYAKRLLSYLDEKNLDKVCLIGHSFGGKVSLKLASKHPERVNKIVLIAASGLKRRHSVKKRLQIMYINSLRRFLRLGNTPWGMKIYVDWFIPRYASSDYKNSGILRQTFVKTVNEDLSEDVKLISAPALLIWGEQDTETPLEMGRRLSGLLKMSRLIELPGKGHEPHLGAGAHLVAKYIKEFISDSDLAAEGS